MDVAVAVRVSETERTTWISPTYIERSDLLSKLTLASRNRLTVLAAPAGYGKTVLLNEWLRASNDAVVAVFANELTDALDVQQALHAALAEHEVVTLLIDGLSEVEQPA